MSVLARLVFRGGGKASGESEREKERERYPDNGFHASVNDIVEQRGRGERVCNANDDAGSLRGENTAVRVVCVEISGDEAATVEVGHEWEKTVGKIGLVNADRDSMG